MLIPYHLMSNVALRAARRGCGVAHRLRMAWLGVACRLRTARQGCGVYHWVRVSIDNQRIALCQMSHCALQSRVALGAMPAYAVTWRRGDRIRRQLYLTAWPCLTVIVRYRQAYSALRYVKRLRARLTHVCWPLIARAGVTCDQHVTNSAFALHQCFPRFYPCGRAPTGRPQKGSSPAGAAQTCTNCTNALFVTCTSY